MNELASDPLRCGFLLLNERDLCAVFRRQGDGVLDVFVDVGCWTAVDDDAVVVFGFFDDVSQYVDQFLLSFLDMQQLVYVDGVSLGFSTLGGLPVTVQTWGEVSSWRQAARGFRPRARQVPKMDASVILLSVPRSDRVPPLTLRLMTR